MELEAFKREYCFQFATFLWKCTNVGSEFDAGGQTEAKTGVKQEVSGTVTRAIGSVVGNVIGTVASPLLVRAGEEVGASINNWFNRKQQRKLNNKLRKRFRQGTDNEDQAKTEYVQAADTIFRVYESQMSIVTDRQGDAVRAMAKIAEESVRRILKFIHDDKSENCNLDDLPRKIYNWVLFGDTKNMSLRDLKDKDGSRLLYKHNDNTTQELTTFEFFNKTGYVALNNDGTKTFYTSTANANGKRFGYRVLLPYDDYFKDYQKERYEKCHFNTNDPLMLYKYRFSFDPNDIEETSKKYLTYIQDVSRSKEARELHATVEACTEQILQKFDSSRPSPPLDSRPKKFGNPKIPDNFHKRRKLCAQMDEIFETPKTAAILRGEAGSGKTLQSFDYALNKKDKDGRSYDVIVFNCESKDVLLSEFKCFAQTQFGIEIHGQSTQPLDVIVDCMKKRSVVFILDNVDNLYILNLITWSADIVDTHYFVVTTQLEDLSGIEANHFEIIDVGEFDAEDVNSFYVKHLLPPLSTDKHGIEKLIKEIGRLPMYVQLTSCFLNNELRECSDFNIATFFEAFNDGTLSTFFFCGKVGGLMHIPEGGPAQVLKMVLMKIIGKGEEGQLAWDILSVSSFLQADNIVAECVFDILKSSSTKYVHRKALGLLKNYSICDIVNDVKDQTIIKIHRMTQGAIREINLKSRVGEQSPSICRAEFLQKILVSFKKIVSDNIATSFFFVFYNFHHVLSQVMKAKFFGNLEDVTLDLLSSFDFGTVTLSSYDDLFEVELLYCGIKLKEQMSRWLKIFLDRRRERTFSATSRDIERILIRLDEIYGMLMDANMDRDRDVVEFSFIRAGTHYGVNVAAGIDRFEVAYGLACKQLELNEQILLNRAIYMLPNKIVHAYTVAWILKMLFPGDDLDLFEILRKIPGMTFEPNSPSTMLFSIRFREGALNHLRKNDMQRSILSSLLSSWRHCFNEEEDSLSPFFTISMIFLKSVLQFVIFQSTVVKQIESEFVAIIHCILNSGYLFRFFVSDLLEGLNFLIYDQNLSEFKDLLEQTQTKLVFRSCCSEIPATVVDCANISLTQGTNTSRDCNIENVVVCGNFDLTNIEENVTFHVNKSSNFCINNVKISIDKVRGDVAFHIKNVVGNATIDLKRIEGDVHFYIDDVVGALKFDVNRVEGDVTFYINRCSMDDTNICTDNVNGDVTYYIDRNVGLWNCNMGCFHGDANIYMSNVLGGPSFDLKVVQGDVNLFADYSNPQRYIFCADTIEGDAHFTWNNCMWLGDITIEGAVDYNDFVEKVCDSIVEKVVQMKEGTLKPHALGYALRYLKKYLSYSGGVIKPEFINILLKRIWNHVRNQINTQNEACTVALPVHVQDDVLNEFATFLSDVPHFKELIAEHIVPKILEQRVEFYDRMLLS